MIEIKNVTKNFGGIRALDGVSFRIEKNKITALIGPNGSGKTTLFNLISQMIKADSGEIYFKDKDLTKMQDYEIAKLGISRTFQDVKLFKNLTIKEHFGIVLTKENEYLIRNMRWKIEDSVDFKKYLDMVGLDKENNTVVNRLSYGQRKLLSLALSLAREHDVLMLDEPVAGVNPKLRIEIKKILKSLKKKGESIFLIEHDMNFVMDIADYIYVLDRGKIISEGKPKKIQRDKKVLEAYLGG